MTRRVMGVAAFGTGVEGLTQLSMDGCSKVCCRLWSLRQGQREVEAEMSHNEDTHSSSITTSNMP